MENLPDLLDPVDPWAYRTALEDSAFARIAMQRRVASMTLTQMRIYVMLCMGATQSAVAHALGCTRQNISAVVNKMREV